MGDTKSTLTDQDYADLGTMSERYSGADIKIVVKGALMQRVKKLKQATHYCRLTRPDLDDPEKMSSYYLTPCSPTAIGARPISREDIDPDVIILPQVTMDDLESSINTQKPSCNDDDLTRLNTFTEEFGQKG